MTQQKDFNNIRQWMEPLLIEKGMSVETLARKIGKSRATIYHWFTDAYRPESDTMIAACRVLGVPPEDGLKQYSPRTLGRPRGISQTREVRTRAS